MRRCANPRDELLRHLPFLRATAIALVGQTSLAEDLVHTTVEKAWNKIDSFTPGTNMRGWLFTILRNTYCSNRRWDWREVPDPDNRAAHLLARAPDHDARLALKDFLTAFSALPVGQREALLLVGAHGHSYESAAELCGVAVGTIKSRVNRARSKLAQDLQIEARCDIFDKDKTMASVLSQQSALW